MKKTSRAKFRVDKVIKEEGFDSVNVELSAVTNDDDKENQEFNKYTPYGELKLMIDNENLTDFFVLNEEYYLDFTKVEK